MASFGKRLRSARLKRGLSQEGLARLVNVSKNSVQNWERSSALPRAEAIVAMSRALDVSSDYLLGLSNNLDPKDPATSP
jgi:transcriptional regulator with XRE-family HTH domain